MRDPPAVVRGESALHHLFNYVAQASTCALLRICIKQSVDAYHARMVGVSYW